jgi:hypothetical protein
MGDDNLDLLHVAIIAEMTTVVAGTPPRRAARCRRGSPGLPSAASQRIHTFPAEPWTMDLDLSTLLTLTAVPVGVIVVLLMAMAEVLVDRQ